MIALIAGDGIGREVIPCAERVLRKLIKAEYVHLKAGFEHFELTSNALPAETVEKIKKCDGALFGAVSSPSHKVKGYSSPIVKLRKELDLYANVRPITGKGIDMVIVRENTECLYIKQERIEDTPNGKVAWADRKISEYASNRIAHVAFKLAESRAKKQVRTINNR